MPIVLHNDNRYYIEMEYIKSNPKRIITHNCYKCNKKIPIQEDMFMINYNDKYTDIFTTFTACVKCGKWLIQQAAFEMI